MNKVHIIARQVSCDVMINDLQCEVPRLHESMQLFYQSESVTAVCRSWIMLVNAIILALHLRLRGTPIRKLVFRQNAMQSLTTKPLLLLYNVSNLDISTSYGVLRVG